MHTLFAEHNLHYGGFTSSLDILVISSVYPYVYIYIFLYTHIISKRPFRKSPRLNIHTYAATNTHISALLHAPLYQNHEGTFTTAIFTFRSRGTWGWGYTRLPLVPRTLSAWRTRLKSVVPRCVSVEGGGGGWVGVSITLWQLQVSDMACCCLHKPKKNIAW